MSGQNVEVIDLIILDELGFLPISKQEANKLLILTLTIDKSPHDGIIDGSLI